jgi:hypothetical protein
MAGPRRIQRKIFKGWRLPPDTVYVGRGSKWGNPFPFGHQVWARDAYAQWLKTTLKGMTLLREHLHELKGKNLACWCKAGDPCHADILIALANETDDVGAPERRAAADSRDRMQAAAPHP